MNTIRYPAKKDWPDILARPAMELSSLDKVVQEVFKRVREEGDQAIAEYTEKFDGVKASNFQVPESEIEKAADTLNEKLRKAINTAAFNIEKFHKAQIPKDIQVETMPGVLCMQKAVPIEKVGLYVPGGTAPLFSTVLMLAIPARVAGCSEIILCSPPLKDGTLNPAILYSAKISGVDKIFAIGGIQAIGAMAYGTQTVPAVYKILVPATSMLLLQSKLRHVAK